MNVDVPNIPPNFLNDDAPMNDEAIVAIDEIVPSGKGHRERTQSTRLKVYVLYTTC